MSTAATTLLVVPCYRHGEALAAYLPDLCTALARCPGRVRILVVDDGSPRAQSLALAAAIERLRPRHPFLQPLLVSPPNHGKGHAIQTGWNTATREIWLAFVDADGAVPADEAARLITLAQQSPAPVVVAAVRSAYSGKWVHRFWYRRLGSWLFRHWVRHQLALGLPDTQCGLKIIHASLHVRAPWREAGFAFDLELLLRARATGLPLRAEPIAWQEKSGSTLGWRDTIKLFAAAYRLRDRHPPSPSFS